MAYRLLWPPLAIAFLLGSCTACATGGNLSTRDVCDGFAVYKDVNGQEVPITVSDDVLLHLRSGQTVEQIHLSNKAPQCIYDGDKIMLVSNVRIDGEPVNLVRIETASQIVVRAIPLTSDSAFDATPSPTPTPTPTATPSPSTTVSFVRVEPRRGLALRLRQQATTKSAGIRMIPSGRYLRVQCQATGSLVSRGRRKDRRWERVSYRGILGYVSRLYVTVPTSSQFSSCESGV